MLVQNNFHPPPSPPTREHYSNWYNGRYNVRYVTLLGYPNPADRARRRGIVAGQSVKGTLRSQLGHRLDNTPTVCMG